MGALLILRLKLDSSTRSRFNGAMSVSFFLFFFSISLSPRTLGDLCGVPVNSVLYRTLVYLWQAFWVLLSLVGVGGVTSLVDCRRLKLGDRLSPYMYSNYLSVHVEPLDEKYFGPSEFFQSLSYSLKT